MFYCVAYDIRCNRLRRRVSIWCKQAGLRRMQRSVFTGCIPPKQLVILQDNLSAAEWKPDDRVCIFPLDKNVIKSISLLGDLSVKSLLEAPESVVYF